ncbi:phosphate transport system permease protein [Halogranum rubrum]|uniref:Phosphate transport system permease protein n=1 Tax=Halogranum rubrum TaxID=553466 RepID=A0A1I4B240_9EURY|nr:phosphate ABC transporter permease subunit PstC [Halogranum rubrum]SFK62764.1 phosphate transport system permease protein [Halogranum rubrum]
MSQRTGISNVFDERLGDSTAFTAVAAVGALSLLATFVLFVVESDLASVALVVFVAAAAYGWLFHQAETAWGLSVLTTLVGIVVLGLILVFLFLEAEKAFETAGLSLLLRSAVPVWSPSQGIYGLQVAIHGTIVTTVIATLIAGPLGVAGALFISEIAPERVGELVKPAIEMLAGIPSIVYGFIGFAILNRYLFYELQLNTQGSLFLAGGVIGLMALPTVVSVAEDAITSVPESMKSGSLALGATDWQTMKGITLPAAFSGVSAAIILGIGRAVGETMAATVILGNVAGEFPNPIFDVFASTATLTSLIASQYGDAAETQLSALFVAGVVLFVIVMFLSLVSQLIERRMRRQLEGDS